MKSIYTYAIAFIFYSFLWNTLVAQNCDTASLDIKYIRAKETDSNIGFETKKHIAFFNPSCTSRNTLVINLIGTDLLGISPLTNFMAFPTVAANKGFHVVSIKYKNNDSEGVQCANSNDIECYEDYHIENLYGIDSLSTITIDSNECILNRIEKLIQYLSANYSSENWSQFLNGNTVDWTKIIIAGHSQGGSHAAFIAHEYSVKRALFFSAPFEYNNIFTATAPWVSTIFQTPDSNLYSFSNLYDEISQFDKQYLAWGNIGILNNGDTLNVDNQSYPYNNNRALYTRDSSTIGSSISAMHGSVYSDLLTFYDNFGTPIFKPVWEYMLGISPTINSIEESGNLSNNVRIFPNPSHSTITIVSEKKIEEIWLINVLGEKCFYQKENKKEVTLTISSLQAGFYLLYVKGADYQKISKIRIDN